MKYILIAYFLRNICAKNCCNRTVYVKIIASQRWDVFETQCRMWANAQRDGRPVEYRWRLGSTPQSLADAHYYSTVQ